MSFVLGPWQLFFVILAGWKLGKKRILLSNDQRRRLAVKGKILGRGRLAEVGALFTPDTILRWHRQLVAQKWDYSDRCQRKPGCPLFRTKSRGSY